MNCSPDGWETLFENNRHELQDISDQLEQEVQQNGPYYPAKRNVFRAFELVRPENVRVVIIGMDPYPGEYQNQCYANGMSFSVGSHVPVTKIPASLKNIFTELRDNYPNITLNSGDLSPWARQGVLLLNACLTVRPGSPGSHKSLWTGFIKSVIGALKDRDDVVFVLWGKNAQALSPQIGGKVQKLLSGHPSPMSVKLFTGNKHFLKINAFFKHIGQPAIDFSIP